MAIIEVACAHCCCTKNVVRNGKASSGLQRDYCKACKLSFQIDFINNANKPLKKLAPSNVTDLPFENA